MGPKKQKKLIYRVPPLALGKEAFAECQGTWHSAKQYQALGKVRHSANLDFAECLALGKARRSAKFVFIFLKKNFAECHPRALGKMFFYFLKTNFAECLLGPALGKDIFAECSPWHSAKYIYIFLFWT